MSVILSFSHIPTAQATSLTIQPDDSTGHDTYDKGSSPAGGNHGTETTMKTISSGCFGASDCPGRSWIKFPLTDIPSGATLNSVTLTINVESKSGSAGNGNPSIKLQRVTSSWEESTLTSSNLPTYDTGSTYEANSTPGGSLGATSFDITTLARDWVSGTVSNYGVRLSITGTLENPLSNFVYNISTSESGTSSNRPKLVIDYTGGGGEEGGGGSSDPTPTPSPSPTSSTSTDTGSGGTGSDTGSGTGSGTKSSTASPSPSPSPTAAPGGTIIKKTAADSCTTIFKDITLAAQDKSARLTFRTTQARGTIAYLYSNARAKNSTTPAVGYDKNSLVFGSNNAATTHDITFTNLTAQTAYFYTIVAGKNGGFSGTVPSCEYSFTTTSPPAASLTTLTGNVYEDGTTTPIPGIKIFFHRMSADGKGWVGYKNVLTDDKGGFAFEYTPTDSYFVGIDPVVTEKQGYQFGSTKPYSSCPATQHGTYGLSWRNGLSLPTTGCRVNIYMAKISDSYPTISGKLLENDTTKGIKNTRIQIYNYGAGGSFFLGQTRTNEAGEWSLKYPPNTPIVVQAITDTNRISGPAKAVYGCKGDGTSKTNLLRWINTKLPTTGCANNIFYLTLPSLQTNPVLSGTVQDATNNQPINDVRVVLYSVVAGQQVYVSQIYTNSQGYWRFNVKPDVTYRAYAYFDVGHTIGYINGPKTVTTACQTTKTTPVSVEFQKVPITDCLDVTFYATPLNSPGSKQLTGHTVNDLTQAPVGTINIRLATLQKELNAWRVVEDTYTNANGQWSFSIIPGVPYFVETRYTAGWLHGFKQPVAGCKTDQTYFHRLSWRTNLLKDSCAGNIIYSMPSDGRITGRLTLPDGQIGIPNSLQRLFYTIKNNNHQLAQYTNSDSQGRFALDCRKGVTQFKLKQDPNWQFTNFDTYIDTGGTTTRKITGQSRDAYLPMLPSDCREPQPVNLKVAITPNSGTFENEIKCITMAYTSDLPGHKAEIHYTINGSRPVITSPLYRDKCLTLSRLIQQAGAQQVTLRAVAFGSESEQAEATYYLTAPVASPSPSPSPTASTSPVSSPSPTVSASAAASPSPSASPTDQAITGLDVEAEPPGDLYTEPVTVTLKASEPTNSDVVILYSTDGSDPREGGKTYVSPIVFNSSVTLNYVARRTSTGETTTLKTDLYNFPITVSTIIRWDPQPGPDPIYTISCNDQTIATTTETSYLNPLQQLDGCVYTVTANDKEGKDLGKVEKVSIEATSVPTTAVAGVIPVASTVAAVGAAVAVATARPEFVRGITSLPYIIHTLWLALLSLLRIRRRHKKWGSVYETVLDSSVRGAIVSLYQINGSQGRLVDRQLSEQDGSYGFIVTPGQFKLTVQKTGFIFPSRASKTIYGGQAFTLTDQPVTGLDLFIDPYELSQKTLVGWRKIRVVVEKLNYPILIAGSAMTVYDLTKQITPFILAVGVVYVGLWLEKIIHHQKEAREHAR